MPTPHADLVAAFAGVELFVGEIEIFAAEWADIILDFMKRHYRIL